MLSPSVTSVVEPGLIWVPKGTAPPPQPAGVLQKKAAEPLEIRSQPLNKPEPTTPSWKEPPVPMLLVWKEPVQVAAWAVAVAAAKATAREI
jgi:hypothetical protein